MIELTWAFVALRLKAMTIQEQFFLFDLHWDFNDLN